ncbi:platelet-activating factor acetylhydrolase, isoform II-domain-containing protein [Lentinula raphanica]|nr:platelet-activating factor acetylhydrolase, isoform II-domain-containing protein [Lentinula raphanica]KAJ3975156.1 platelet-activating factor acetylhydrolase, isoform II-domain-containing protein [Lentinula raphanica]
MFLLRDPRGRHSVGATRCTIPLETPIIVGNANIPGQDEPGIRLEEVAFTVFYPTSATLGNKQQKKGLRWLTGPLHTEIAGLGHFAGVSRWMIWLILTPFLYAYGQFVKIPVYQDAPLQRPSEEGAKWPLVIFSHGLGGSPTTYSQLCTRLAASGKVVIAMEHRDGTMPSCIVPYKGSQKPLFYVRESDVSWVEKPQDTLPLRVDQLIIRQHEIYTTYAAFTKLVKGDSDIGSSIRFTSTETTETKHTWSTAPIDVNDICLAGHSFGGCTMFSLLSSKPPIISEVKSYPQIPVRDTLILDPWLEPLPSPGPTPLSDVVDDASATTVTDQLNQGSGGAPNDKTCDPTKHNNPRLLVINSEAFTLWSSHFERLANIVKCWGPNAKLLTLVKSAHTSFSDYHVFPFIGSNASAQLIDIISDLSIAFLNSLNDDWLSDWLSKDTGSKLKIDLVHTMPEKIVIGKWPDGHNRHRFAGELGQIVHH